MQTLPTQQYRRQAVRDNLDIVGKFTNETFIPNECQMTVNFCFLLFLKLFPQYPLAVLWDYFWEPAF